MKLDQFTKPTSQLRIPTDIYELYDKVVKRCETCSKMMDAPPTSKVSGLRSEIFGDLFFVDHGSVKYASASDRKDREYYFLIILDGATNFVYANPVDSTGIPMPGSSVTRFPVF
jgi:hypothetical protein